ncbi:hypothetical protein JSO54_09590 [Riemerella anatipestifer]|uniref:hypothetical protein n=1 Tax=Riemerella anatipestifer TaxID=34085 RepID=UPI0030BAF322
MKDTVEKLLKFLPLLSIIILLSSILKNYIYFSNFSVNINEYIDLSEFPLLFINDVLFYFLFIISFIIYLPFIYARTYFRNKYGSENFSFKYSNKFTNFAIPAVIILTIYTCFDNSPLDIKLIKIMIYLTLIFAFILLYLDKDIEFSKNYCLVFSIFFMFLFSVFNAFSDIYKIENGKAKQEVSFEINDELIKTDKLNNIFLGKSRSFIFIYNKKTKETEVYKFDEL